MAFDWISNLFSGGSAKGLSGPDSEPLDASDYYASRLRKHKSQGDLVDDPYLLWSDGLRAHLSARAEDGSTDFTDVVLIINEEDWSRTFQRVSEPWTDTAARLLGQEFDSFCQAGGLELPYASRASRFRIVQDGGAKMEGEDYALEAGEFITGLLPNIYAGASPASRPVIAVHLNLPDVWDGYREVGRLHSDQVSFTLGNHWLDNFSHFTLQEPALYRLQQHLDGNFVHIIDPDLQERYSVVSNDGTGANVLSIIDADGEAVAHLVLALLDSMVPDAPDMPASEPDVDVAASPAIDMPQPPVGLIEPISTLGHGSKTIVPESVQERIFSLRERGALLQKVHFRKFMQGYDVYVGPNGSLSTALMDRAATFQIRKDTVSLLVHKPDVLVNGRAAKLEQPTPLYGSTTIKVGAHELVYNDLSDHRPEHGWPYLGEILRPASSTHMVFGGVYKVGRDRRCKVQLPDEPQNDNIAWLPDLAHGATIRARSGEIPKSRFYTDSIMVASEHAEIDLTADPKVTSIARHCYSYVRRGREIIALVPSKQQGLRNTTLQSGDDLMIGNCLFEVGYAPEDGGSVAPEAPPPPPPPKLTPESLAKAVSEPDVELVEDPPPDQPNLIDKILSRPAADRPARGSLDDLLKSRISEDDSRSSGLDALLNERGVDKSGISSNFDALLGDRASDVPVAGGLGETGKAPPVPDLGKPASFDSLIGDTAPPQVLQIENEDPVGDLPEDSTDLPSILPRIDQIEAEDQLDESGEHFGLPSPESPRRGGQDEFDVADEGTGGLERVVPIKTYPQKQLPPDKSEEKAPLPSAKSVPLGAGGEIVAIDDEDGGVELARPARLVHIGWTLSGEAILGNYQGCTGVIPETRYEDDQKFARAEYVRLKVRGRRAKAEVLNETEARLNKGDTSVSTVKDLAGVRIEIIRRDEEGDEDFSVFLDLDASVKLPDPRARLLAVDHSDDIVAALFVRGLPLRADRRIALGPIRVVAHFDGSNLRLQDYIDTYRKSDGYEPFFLKSGDDRFRTAPEDGGTISLSPGDLLIAGSAVYRFEMA
ncbi:MAG TPA: hypothetical protein QGF58_07970 [Myxococcota bacterium]|nr:hypothetical protein [Myxococcota bacterium]